MKVIKRVEKVNEFFASEGDLSFQARVADGTVQYIKISKTGDPMGYLFSLNDYTLKQVNDLAYFLSYIINELNTNGVEK